MKASSSSPPPDTEVRCRPCRKSYLLAKLANPIRCPECGGPMLSVAQLSRFDEDTRAALKARQDSSSNIMRLTSLSMVSVQVMTYFFEDREAATFFNDVVTTAAAAATVATEVWAYTASRVWMLLASIMIQIAAILFFFVAAAALAPFLGGRISVFVACLPLAGSLAAWHHFRAYSHTLRLHEKACRPIEPPHSPSTSHSRRAG